MNNRNVFKCCSRKEFSNFICVVCYNVFHNSCLERKSDVIKMGGYKILCSSNCQHNNQLSEEQEANYKETIRKLQIEVAQREDSLKRLKRNSKVFEDEIMETEQGYVNTIEEQKLRIIQLKNEILLLNANNEKLKADIESRAEQILQLEKQIKDLNDMSKSMISTIRMLENESKQHLDELTKIQQGVSGNLVETLSVKNKVYVQDLKETNCEIFSLREEPVLSETTSEVGTALENNNPSSCTVTAVSDSPPKIDINTNVRQSKVIVLTDDCGKYLHDTLRKALGPNYTLQVFCKPYARFKDVISGVGCVLGELTSGDYVLVLAGMNDSVISLKDVTQLANKCFYTNLIISSVPISSTYSDSNLASRISGINDKLFKITTKLKYFCNSIDFLNLHNRFGYDEWVRDSVYLNGRGLSKLARMFVCSLQNFYKMTTISNLVRISLNTQTVEEGSKQPVEMCLPLKEVSIESDISQTFLDCQDKNLVKVP